MHDIKRHSPFERTAERPGHTLRATALVNEPYLRLVGSDASFNDRVHFYAVAAKLLRHILVDHAKAQIAKSAAVARESFRSKGPLPPGRGFHEKAVSRQVPR
jgi:hypothetical protein